ncbi:MAG: TIM barrel protein [bacterium]
MIRIGRNFTNLFIVDVLSESERARIISGDLDLFSMNAIGIVEFKKRVISQIDRARELGLNHIELDADMPSPYGTMPEKECFKIRDYAAKNDITLSVHLSYSGIGSGVACIQEEDRSRAVGLQKIYIDFAKNIGAKYLNMHPGTAPFYMDSPLWMEKIEEALIKSVTELAEYSKPCKFHIENNVSFDTIYVEPEDIIRVVKKCREKGAEVYFNLDIGHWFTRADAPGGKAKPVPENPENIMKKIPKDFVKELHLNDYVPKKFMFHPPLHLTEGPLQRKNLIAYGEIVRGLEPEVIILETAAKTKEQVAQRQQLVEEEMKYVKECLKI